MKDDQLLWKPSQQQIQQSNLAAFIDYVNRHYPSADHQIIADDYATLYRWSIEYSADFWHAIWQYCDVLGSMGSDVLLVGSDNNIQSARWFPVARLNYAQNCLRQTSADPAIIFCNERREKRYLTHAQLYSQVSKMVVLLKRQGIKKGDRVAAYMPNIPETIIASLATAAIGAIWSSCSPDFGVNGVIDRFGQIQPKLLFAVNGYSYNRKAIDITERFEAIIDGLPSVQQLIVYDFLDSNSLDYRHPKIGNWQQLLAPIAADNSIEFEPVAFDHPLFIMFSSGTTGIPKCIVHSTGGTLLQHLKEHQLHTDIKSAERLFYFTSCGWMMWNWLLSGLASGATLCLYDGAPLIEDGKLLFDYVDAEKINVFGTSAKFIDAIAKAGLTPNQTHNLQSLRSILSTGSTLAAESFDYVYRHIKQDLCLSSISGGTDIISCFALGNPILPVYRGELQCLGLGLAVDVYGDEGQSLASGQRGELVCKRPFPSMPVGFWNDEDGSNYHRAYFERFENCWCHGDYVELTPSGGMIIHGRSDTLLNPAGVRIGTAEIYRPVQQVDEVLEAIVIGQRWQGDTRLILFVRLRESTTLDQPLIAKIKRQIRADTTPRHVPEVILQVADIPRTKSGKIVELAVTRMVHNEPIANIEALANPESLQLYRNLPQLQSQ